MHALVRNTQSSLGNKNSMKFYTTLAPSFALFKIGTIEDIFFTPIFYLFFL